jgi:hypothetical protein
MHAFEYDDLRPVDKVLRSTTVKDPLQAYEVEMS